VAILLLALFEVFVAFAVHYAENQLFLKSALCLPMGQRFHEALPFWSLIPQSRNVGRISRAEVRFRTAKLEQLAALQPEEQSALGTKQQLLEEQDTFVRLDDLTHIECVLNPLLALLVQQDELLLLTRQSPVKARPTLARHCLVP